MSGLTEEQEREITIRDNVNNGQWNWDELANWGEDLAKWGVNMPIFEALPDIDTTSGGSVSDRMSNEDLRDSMSIALVFDKAGFIEFMTYANYFKENYGVETVTEAVVQAVKEQYENAIR